MKKLLLLLLLFITNEGYSQVFVQIGSGSDSSTASLYSPLIRLSGTMGNRYCRSNIVLTQQELALAGMPPGATITGIAFNKTNVTDYAGYSFYHGFFVANSTISPPLATTTSWASILASHTKVYTDSNQTMPNGSGWVTFNFSTPVLYTGQNLSIATEQDWSVNQTGYNAAVATNWQLTSGFEDHIVGVIATTIPANLSGTAATYKRRPNIRVYYSLPTGTDAALLNFVTPNVPVFSNAQQPVTLNVANAATNAITALTINYQLNTGTVVTENWVGNIQTGTSSTVTFNTILTAPATPSFQLKAWISSVNGTGLDLVRQNDTINSTFCTVLNNVNYTVGGTGADFASLQAAFDQINCGGISGNVNLSLMQSDTGSFTLNNYPSTPGSALTITAGAPNVTLSNAGTGSVLSLIQASNVTISNIIFERTAAPAAAQDLISLQNCTNYTIINNTFIGLAGSTSANNRLLQLNGTNTGYIVQNQFTNGYYGVYSPSVTGSVNSTLSIFSNTFENTYLTPIHIVGTSNTLVIDGNTFTHNSTSIATTGYAINLTNCEGFTISNNKQTGNIGISALFLSNFSGSVATPNRVYNNSFNSVYGNATPRAIHFTASTTGGLDYLEVYHNSFKLTINTTSTTQNGIFYFTGGTPTAPAIDKVHLKNNVISVENLHATPSTVLRTFYIANRYVVDAGLLSSDYNDYFFPSATTFAYLAAATPVTTIATLAEWRTNYLLDSNSIQANPVFASPTDNTPLANSPLNNAATPIPYITVDINGLGRSATSPDIGAHEILVFSENLFALDIVSPTQSITVGTPNTVSFRFVNIGTNAVTSAMVHYQLGNSAIVSQAFTGNLQFQDTTTFTFATPLVVPNANNLILRIWTSLPNGVTDGNVSNDSLRTILCLTLPAGTYTIGSPTSNFPSFDELTNYLNCAGIGGPVVFEVDFPNNISNETITIGQIPGSSAINTVTFKGNNDTIIGTPPSSRYAVVLLNGAKHIIFRDFYVRNLATSNTFGIQLTNGADSNIVRGNTIEVNDNVTATTVNGIILGSTLTSATAAGSASYNTIDSNLIMGGGYGIRINGGAGSINSINNMVAHNEIRDFYNFGITLSNTDGAVIAFNDIHRLNRSGAITTAYFIDLAAGAQGSIIRSNRIHDSHTAAPTNTSAAYGIRATSNNPDPAKRNKIYNNLIYKLYSNGTTNGILYNNSHNTDIYYNTIVMDFGTATAGASRGIYFQGTCTGVDFRYNNVYVSKAGTGDKQGIFVENVASSITSEKNNFYINAPSGLQAIGNYGSTNFATLALWQTANAGAYDQLSVSVDPLFVDSLNNNYTPQAATLDGAGLPVAYIQDDFFGNPRSPVTPDLGSIEFSPSSIDLGLTNVLSYMLNGTAVPLVSSCFGSLQNTLRVEVVNNGSATVNSAQITFQVNSTPPVTETISTPITSGGVLHYIFTTPATFTNGLDTVKVWVKATNDAILINDTVQTIISTSLLTVLQVPYTNTFETPATLQQVCDIAESNSKIEVLGIVGANNLAITGNGSLVMSGSTSGASWVAPTATNWSSTNLSFTSTASLLVRADTLSRLKMSFNLKQLYAGTSLSTNFRVLVNNQAVIPDGYTSSDFRPANAAASTTVLNLVYSLDAFVGDTVNITFLSNVRYDYNSNPMGANVIDDLQIFQPIEPRFDSISRITGLCTPSARIVQATITSVLAPTVNLKYHINSGPVQTVAMTQTGNVWSGNIPAASLRDSISYFVEVAVPQVPLTTSAIQWYRDGYLYISAGPDQTIVTGNSATLNATIGGGSGNAGLGGLLWTEVVYYKGAGASFLQTTFPSWLPNTASDDDYFELTNTSPLPITLAGKRVRAATGTINLDFTFPAGAVLASGDVAVLLPGSGTSSIINNLYYLGGTGNNIFSSTSNPAGVVLYDTDGTTVIDAVRYNTNDFPIAFGVPASAWTGTISGTASFPGLFRVNALDSNSASDWLIHSATNKTSIGYINSGITVSSGTVTWTNLAGNVIGNTLSLVVSPTITTTYIVTINDGVCIARDTMVVTVAAQLPDVGVSRIISPTPGAIINTPQTIIARVKNFGSAPVSGFDITYVVGATTNTNTITSTIQAGDSLDWSFPVAWTPTFGGTFNLCVFTLLSGDANVLNDTSCITVGSTISVENHLSSGTRIYPNPASDILTIALTGRPGNIRMFIADVTGKIVLEDEMVSNNVDINFPLNVQSMSEGLYLLRIVDQAGQQTSLRFVISR